MKLRVQEIIDVLEKVAPRALQEDYDNSGLIVGDRNSEISSVLVCLDSTEEVVDEAIEKGAGLIVAHHPIIFSGLKSITGRNYVERVILKAIRNNIGIYAIHTNLDNVLHNGVNQRIAEKLGLKSGKILMPMGRSLSKLVCFCPADHVEIVRTAICGAGAGHIGNYDFCTFGSEGEGTFRPGHGTNPFSGRHGELNREAEVRLETIMPSFLEGQVISAMKEAHPYEEVAYDIYPLSNSWEQSGAGLIGELSAAMTRDEFLAHLKAKMKANVIRYTDGSGKPVKRIAVCGGSGSFVLSAAMRAGADALVTSDFKYHQFFDGENQTMICDIGHYESEQFTIELLGEILLENLSNFAVILTGTNTNPVLYYY